MRWQTLIFVARQKSSCSVKKRKELDVVAQGPWGGDALKIGHSQ